MTDDRMTREELQNEVRTLRARVAELERAADRETVTSPSLCAGLSLRDVLDHADGFLGILSPDGILVEVNRSPLEVAGFRREQVIDRPFWKTGWWDRSPAARDQLRADFAEALRGGRVRREMVYFTAAGEERFVDRTLTPVADRTGRVSLVVEGRDVTDRRRAEEALARSERRFQAMVEGQFDGISLLASDGTVLYLTPSACRLLGYTECEVVGRSALEFTHPDDVGLVARVFADARGRPRTPVGVEHRVRHRDGAWRWVEVAIQNRLDEPAVRAIVRNYRDVTERKQAEESLRRARDELEERVRARTAEVEAERERLAEVFHLAPSFMAVLRGPGHIFERANDRFVELVGGRDLNGRSAREAFPEVEGQGFFELLDRVYRTGEPFVGTDARMNLRRAGGLDALTLEFVYQPMRDATGVVTGILVQGIDQTERLRAQEGLRESEERFAQFMRHLPGYAWMKDLAGRYVYASEAVARLLGLGSGELLGKSDDAILPPRTAALLKEHDARSLAESGVLVTESVADLEGRVRHYLVSKFPIRGTDGKVSLVGGVAFDITDRIQAEEALRASEERFAQFMRHLPGHAWVKDPGGRYIYANDRVREDFHVEGAIQGRTCEALVSLATAARFREQDRQVLDTGMASQFVQPIDERDGSRRDWLVTKFLIPGQSGGAPLVGGVGIDVTEQLRAERALREQAELLDLATDAILIFDPTGAITYWNRGAEQLYGWQREEALGRNAHDLLRTAFPQPLDDILAQVVRSGHWEGELTHTRREGSTVVVSSHWNRRLDGDGEPAVLEINTDITGRKQAAELREQFVGRLIAAQEEERGRVARELHDGVAQTLAALHCASRPWPPGPFSPRCETGSRN